MHTNTYKWLNTIFLIPAKDLVRGQVDYALKDFASSSDAYHIRNTGWTLSIFGVFEPSHHLRLPWLPQRDSIEEDITVLLADKCDSCLDLKFAERIKGMWRRDLSGKMGRCLLQSVECHGDDWVCTTARTWMMQI